MGTDHVILGTAFQPSSLPASPLPCTSGWTTAAPLLTTDMRRSCLPSLTDGAEGSVALVLVCNPATTPVRLDYR